MYHKGFDKDLSKEVMYEGVKQLIDCAGDHIHLPQQKLYTLFSIGFNYLLFKSTKEPGHYIIRVEDSYLLDKLQRKSKDRSSRRFMQSLALPRKLKYGNSFFHLDFFNFSTWANTNELPRQKVKGALIVKNANKKPFGELFGAEEDEQLQAMIESMPRDYYLSSLKDFAPVTVTIAYDETYEGVEEVRFPFIKEEPKEKVAKGVNIANDINLEDLEE